MGIMPSELSSKVPSKQVSVADSRCATFCVVGSSVLSQCGHDLISRLRCHDVTYFGATVTQTSALLRSVLNANCDR